VRRLKQCDEDIIPQRREKRWIMGREVVDNCGAILAPHRLAQQQHSTAMDQATATDTDTAFENEWKAGAAGCQDQRQGEGEWEQQHRAEKSRTDMERTPHYLGFGIAGQRMESSLHQGMVGAIIITARRTVSCFWRWSVAAISS
jgi:hypothetical protein